MSIIGIVHTVNRPEILSSVRMKLGDIFEAGSELCVVIDDGYNDNGGAPGAMWRHKTRPATEEERITYEVMKL